MLLLCDAVIAEPKTDFESFSHDEAFAYSQQAIGTRLEGVELIKPDGSAVSLESYRGKPLVLSMIYSSCHHICPGTTRYLHQIVQKARSALDTDSFQVVSIGFDTANDTPERMEQFGTGLGIDDPNWDFLAADSQNMSTLVDQLGFIYYPSPKGFEHLVQTTIIDAKGEIYRQVYGMSFETPALIEPLKDLVFDHPQAQSALGYMSNRIRLFCTVYDPATDNYYIDISVFIGTFVGLIVSLVFGRVLVKEWRRSIRAG
jgi:protein SCO1/2